MPLAEIELSLTDQECAFRDTVHKFAEEVMRPAGAELDRLADPAQVVARDSVLWGVFDKAREVGLADLEAGGASLDPLEAARLRCLVNEELGWGDSGARRSAAGRSPSPTTEATPWPSTSLTSRTRRSAPTASRARKATSG
jgi:acyl-CoA dehydrogenase